MSYRKRPRERWITKDTKHVLIRGPGNRKSKLPKIGKDVIVYGPPRVNQLPQIAREKMIVDSALNKVLNWAPIISELHTAYVIADSTYDNWNLISKLYDTYEKSGWQGVAELIETNETQDRLSNIQTTIVWSTICKFVPARLQNEGKEILSEIMDKVTSAEVGFVGKFLADKKNEANERVTQTQKRNYASKNIRPENWKVPDDVRYV